MTELLPIPVENVEAVEGEVIDGAFFMLEPNPFRRSESVLVDGLPHGSRLDAYVARARAELPDRFKGNLEVWIGGHCIDPRYWSQIVPKPDHLVYIRALPRGKGAKNVLRAVLLIAVVVAAYYFGGPLGGSLAASLGITSMSALVSAVVVSAMVMVGTLLVNALIPAPGLTNDTAARDPRYQLTGSSNRYAPYAPIPRVFGTTRVYPVLGGQPYTEISGKDQYLRMLLVVGWGPLDITDIRIGDTPITSFVGAEVEITEGGPAGWSGNQTLSLYNRDVTETSLNIETLYATPTAVQTTPLATVEIGVDITFPQGLIEWTKKGDKLSRTVRHKVEYRAVGSGTWLTPNWEYDETGRTQSGGIIECIGLTQDQYRAGGKWKVASGQYEVRVTRETAAGIEDASPQIDRSYWTAIRTFTASEPVLQEGLCMIALRLKATDQLNGVPDRISCLVKSYLPTYNGTTWSYALTRNPAWAYADLLRRRGGVSFLPDSRIDLATIQSWATACDATAPNASEPRWTFDGVLEGGSVFEGLRTIATIGRAAFTIKDGKYSVVRDVEQATPVQHITPANSWGYSGSKMFVEIPHALKVEFQNKDEDYRVDERYVYDDGYDENNATKFEVLQLFGATSPTLVWREARYHLAVGKLRPEEHTVYMDIEALRCQMGSRVELSHDVILVGTGFGRVKSRQLNGGGNVEALVLDSPVTFETGNTYQLRVRHADGTSSLRTVTSPGGALGEFNTVYMTPEAPAAAPAAGDLFMFGESGIVTAPMIVKKIEPSDNLSCRLTLINYDAAIYTADTGTIPAFTSYMTALPSTKAPATPRVAIRTDDTAMDVLSDGTVATRIAVDLAPGLNSAVGTESFEVQYRAASGDVDWSDAGMWPASTTTVWINGVRIGGDYIARVRSRGTNGLYSAWVETASTAVAGKSYPPAQPTGMAVTAGYREIYVTWTNPEDLDLSYVEVWASQTNSFGTATLVGRSVSGAFTHANLAADGAPWYYWLISVDLSENAATQAYAGTTTALTIVNYEGIGDDAKLTPQEKLLIVREKANLDAEQSSITAAASAAGVSSTSYTTALTALGTYLGGLSPAWNSTTTTTSIVRATWNTKWGDVYAAREALLSAISQQAQATADGKVTTFYAAGAVVPTPTKDWAFTSALPAGFTMTRTGSATRVNSSGYIEDVTANNPRFDHDPVTLAAKGLLVEAGRTNLFPFSEALTSVMTTAAAAWTSDTQTSPKNATTAETLTASAGSARHIAYMSFTGTAATYALSIFLKQGTARYAQLQLTDDGAAKRYGVVIDLQTGTVTDTNSSGTPSGTSYRVEAFGNGWYRLSITMTLTAATCYGVLTISNSGTPSYDSFGNPTFNAAGTETIHAWGGQLEVGAFATSYIPNTSSGSTSRGTEYAEMSGTDFSSWFTAAQGTFYVEADTYYPSYNATALMAYNNASSDASGLLFAMHDLAQFIWFDGSGSLVADLDAGSTAANTTYKMVGAWAANDFAASRDGGAALTDTAGTYGNTAAYLRIGGYRGDQYPLNGHIKAIKFWNTRQSNSNLAAISGGTGSAPTAEGVGDLWVNTSENNKLYRWSGTAWVAVQDGAIDTAQSLAAAAQSTANSKVTTFYQTSAPTALSTGDLWVDTDDGNKLYRWSGSAWVNVQDAAIGTAQSTADSKVKTFVQTSAPTATAVGDYWIDSDDNNHPYRWSGSAWVSMRDGGAAWALLGLNSSGEVNTNKVLTSSIQDNAVTTEGASYTASTFSSLSTTDQNVQSLTITTTGEPVILLYSLAWVQLTDNEPGFSSLYRGSDPLITLDQIPVNSGEHPTTAIVYVDQPSAGTYTYYVKARLSAGSSGQISVRYRSLIALEVKK